MKILRILLIVLGIMALVLVLAGIFGQKSFNVERSITIDAPVGEVFPYVQYFEKHLLWNPWNALDPAIKTTISEPDGEVGTQYEWVGNDKVGAGKQVMTVMEPNQRVETHLTFLVPFESESDASLVTEVINEQSTKVTWTLKGENGFISRIFTTLFMNMDEAIGADYEKGLITLKALVESESKKTYDGFTIQKTTFPGYSYAMVRKTMKMEEVDSEFLGAAYGTIMAGITKAQKTPMGPPSALAFSWDETSGMADIGAAIAVDPSLVIGGDVSQIQVAKGEALLVDYYGSYAGTEKAHGALEKYCKEKGLEYLNPVIEEYITDPMQEPDTSKWLTKVIYRLK